jgi:uncharacterized protein (DUF433 family)
MPSTTGQWYRFTDPMRFDRITTDPNRMNGQPCIRDPRLTARRVLEIVAAYPDRADLRHEYPELEDDETVQALGFAATMFDDPPYGRAFDGTSF